jgi:heat shock protein HtpX
MNGNWLKTTLLMAGIVVLFGTVGRAIGGQDGMIFALLLGGGMNLFAYWFSDKMVLKMYQAREVTAAPSPWLHFYNMVKDLSQRAGLPMPKVYIIHENQPNAFATGRNPEHAAVAATTGLLGILTERELRGVMSHELAHVKHRDILISTLSATIAGAISVLAHSRLFYGGHSSNNRGAHPVVQLLVMLLAPLAAMLIQMAISRAREYEADRGGAEISGDPAALAEALGRIETHVLGTPLPAAEENPATAQMMIINPLLGGNLKALFSTHPPTKERIARLMKMR